MAGEDALEGVVFTEVNSDKPKFRAEYSKAFPSESYNPAAYLCYSAVASILEAVKTPEAFQSEESLRNAIVNVHQVNLLDGTLAFDKREAQFDLVLRQFHSGKVESLGSARETAASK